MKKKEDIKKLFGTMLTEWKWMLKYTKRFRASVLLFVLLGLLAIAVSLGASVASKYLIDAVVQHSNETLLKYAVMVVGLALLQCIFTALSSFVSSLAGSRANNEIREDIFYHALSAKMSDTQKFHSGEIINRLEGDANAVSNGVIGFIPGVITKLVQFLGALSIVLYYDSTMAVLALMSAPILVLSSRFLLKTIRKYSTRSRELNGEVIAFSEEAVQNTQLIKAFDLTRQYADNFKTVLKSYRSVKLSYDRFSILMTLCLSVIGLLVSYSCYGWGVYRLWQNAISFGTMTLFLQISGLLTSSFGALASFAPSAVSIATAAGRIMQITSLTPESDSDYEKAVKFGKLAEKNGADLVFSNVSFAYASNNPVLKNVSFRIKCGQTVAFTGASGEGKTTLFKLVLGLISPTEGKIYLEAPNGETLIISDSTRRFCSYVPQEINMFSGSIAHNLRLVNPNADDSELFDALKKADIFDFINTLKDGTDTIIGEGGEKLSLGQLQRIAIARALLKKSLLLLLDETTSALDAQTEKNVLNNIMQSDKNRICLITTHRSSMLQYSDSVYNILPDGTVSLI